MVRFLTAGESHGQGLVTIVEGVPAGLPISEDYIGAQLSRRQRGYGGVVAGCSSSRTARTSYPECAMA